MRLLALALFLALLSIAPHAGADGRMHPALALAVSRLDKARGPDAHTALREIWSSWDRASPAMVEEALLAAEADKRRSPAARAYAGWLWAHARVRRGDIAASEKKIAELGFVTSWLVVGPFDNEGRRGLGAELGPEAELAQVIVPGRAYSGKERPVRWRAVPDVFKSGYLDMGSLLRPERKVCGFATTFVSSSPPAKAERTISAWVGATGAFTLYWNGREVLTDPRYRTHDVDRRAAKLKLAPGPNRLVVKVCGDEAPPAVSVRLGDAEGRPDRRIVAKSDLTANEPAAALAQALTKKSKKGDAAAAAGGLEGPLQAFERLTTGTPRAADEEAFARYLALTGGDDGAEHKARDLARSAAEREPTVARLLLAGELAEDRNRRAEWVKKAEALADKLGQADVEVVLARAELAASGPAWQQASRHFDAALALDPDRIEAVQGRVAQYNTAGLKRSALATLERALERNPESVALLNMQASQLRALGRSVEASEVEARYSALRFDDQTYLGSRIELALARRDRVAAERWVDRLLALEPDNQWALGTAARAYRALGQPERAVATHQRALALAPEDVGTLRTLADLFGELGRRDKQLELLQAVLKIRPQDKEVREYVEHIEPDKPRPDEKYAWASKKFLKLRHARAQGQNQRVLRDLTVTTVFANGLSSKFRQIVFQPLSDAGAALARNYTFQYESDRETVQLRGARVYRGDGRVDEAIEFGEGAADDPTISMYTSARNFYVQFPRLDPGDVVELRYRVDQTTARNEFADYFGEIVYFGSTEPVKNAEYVLITPKNRTVHIEQNQPGLRHETAETSEQLIHMFFAKEVPSIVPEPAMPPWAEVLGFVHVSTFKTWKDLGQWYWGLVKEQFDLDEETRKLAREITKGKTTEVDKVKAVYNWVVKNTRYVALEFGIYGYKPRRCVQTVSRGWGDCKDKATVIVTLLEQLGIPSTIVVLRTQMRGDLKSKIASLAPFDHAIAYVPSLDLYLDGTAEYTGSSELPDMDAGAVGLLVNKGDTEVVRLPHSDPKRDVVERRVEASVSPNGDAKLEIDWETRGSDAADWRRRYHAEATRRDRINTDLGREFPGFEILGVTASDLTNLEQPVKLEVRGTARGFARKEGSQLSMVVTPNAHLTASYASLSKRTHDVRIVGFSTIDDTFVVKLPAGASVVSAPVTSKGTSPFGSWSVEVAEQPGQVTVKSRVEVRARRIKPAEYAAWKKFCEDVDRVLATRLVVGS